MADQTLEQIINKARQATYTLRDAVRLGTIIEFRQRDPLVLDICRALDQVQALLDSHGRETPKTAQFYGAPLEVKVEQGALVVRIGIETLAHAVTYSDWANPYDEATGDYLRSFAITDAPQFASDVAHAMLHEREDGSTPLSDFIDKMSQSAVDDGSVGLHEDFNHRIKHGEKSPLETW